MSRSIRIMVALLVELIVVFGYIMWNRLGKRFEERFRMVELGL